MEELKVTFQPSGKTVMVPRGMSILDAAAKVGILIETPCGGQGRCGRCMVRVDQGGVSHRENIHLTQQQIEEGWVLSCVARAQGDLVVSVPAEAQREKGWAEEAPVPVSCDWPLYPGVRQLSLQIPAPSLADNATDLERLNRVFKEKWGIDATILDLSQLRELAKTLREGDWQLTATIEVRDHGNAARIIDISPGTRRRRLLGVAVDIGTTNVVVDLVDMRSGRFLDRVSARNRQALRGEDVISRIIYSERAQGMEELHQLVIGTINELLNELVEKHRIDNADVCEMVVAGNTTMTHLFLGLPPQYIRQEPYVPTANQFPVITARELGLAINPNAPVYCLPSIAAYVGGDISAGVLSSCLYQTDELTLFLDVGTNGELVLGNADWMATCACSAGPAFEGGGVRHGMRAIEGAIEDVRINSKTLEPTLQVMGDVAPHGICGSGMIAALAEMFLTGVIDRAGRINLEYVNATMGRASRARVGEHGAEYVLVWAQDAGVQEDIVLTEVDINNLIRAKAAIYAGIAVMAKSLGIPLSDIKEVLIGGAFGRHINVEQAIQIGLLPDLPWDRFKYLGNTSARGAGMVLLSRHARSKAEEIAGRMTYLELIADNSFMNEFTAALFLPHTETDRFPSVEALMSQSKQPEPSPTTSLKEKGRTGRAEG